MAFCLCDFADVDFGVMGTMTVFLAETFPSFHFEGDHLITLYMTDDFSFDNSLDVFSYGKLVAMGQKDFSELNFVAGIACDPGNVQSLVFLDLKLLTGYFHYC
jgi:hypothetical protein